METMQNRVDHLLAACAGDLVGVSDESLKHLMDCLEVVLANRLAVKYGMGQTYESADF